MYEIQKVLLDKMLREAERGSVDRGVQIKDGWLVKGTEQENRLSKISYCHPIQEQIYLTIMSSKTDVWQGTLALMVLKTLERTGSLHGYGIARQIEQTSADLLSVNYGTLYPALLKLEQEGYITSEWGLSDNNRKAKFYQLTRAGRKQIEKETQEWEQMASILARFLNPKLA